MDGLRRRAFCGLLVAAGVTVPGCSRMSRRAPGGSAVSTRRELEAAFDDLSPGETIRIDDGNAPYRTTQWLDVDVDDVTVVGPGTRDLIKPADGANVGGIRVGHHDRCRGVEIRGIGYHGNPAGQDPGADRLHGIAVRDAEDVTLEHNRIRHTHPRRHGDGGSGISVTHRCSDVQVLDNRVHEFGDRGVQLAGERIVVSGNVVSAGLDRPVACDLWYPDGRNRTAESVTVNGNLLGDSVEGSLVGVARNTPLGPTRGHVNVFGNVGFGAHKSFCHVRGPEPVRNVSVQSNVSVQDAEGLRTEETVTFAGVAVDVEEGANVSIENNEFYDYSGHGIHVDSDIEDLSVRNNRLSGVGLSGIRVAGARNGLVDGNLVTDTGAVGIRLVDTAEIALRGNYVRGTGGAGIVSRGTGGGTDSDIGFNYVTGVGRGVDRPAPAVAVRDTGVRVRGNTIRHIGGPAILEGDGARDNLFEDNRANGPDPWRIRSPTSRVRNHTPPVDAHRAVPTDGPGGVVRVRFDRPYAEPPRLSFGRRGGGIEDVRYRTDGNGDYVGAAITVGQPGAPVDVFVSDG